MKYYALIIFLVFTCTACNVESAKTDGSQSQESSVATNNENIPSSSNNSSSSSSEGVTSGDGTVATTGSTDEEQGDLPPSVPTNLFGS